MKKLTFLLISLFACLLSFAGEVTEQQALQIAQKFMQGKHFKQQNLRRAPSAASSNAYYVFNAENNGGFVIVAGDDRMTEILGYAERGSFDLANAPENVRWWLSLYEKAATSATEQLPMAAPHRAEETKAAIAPFITTTWGQNYPYNTQCPQIDGTNCLTGCVATAMAQVMNYTRCPEGETDEIAAYTTKTNGLSLPKLDATTFPWDNMTNDDVARLMRYCGQSVSTDYGIGESGAYDVRIPGALVGKFGYDKAIRLVYRNGYNSETWENMIYAELQAGRPVIYGGQSNMGGHSFIVHGYQDGRLYINWGWDGSYDGYFELPALTPMYDNDRIYSREQTAIIGIQKSTGGDTANMPKVTVTKLELTSETSVTRTSTSDDFTGISIETTLMNSFADEQTAQIGYALYQGDEQKQVISSENISFTPAVAFTSTATLSFDSALADGTYRIVPVYREDETKAWTADEGSNYRYVEATIAGSSLELKKMPDAAHDERLKFNIISDDEVEVAASGQDIEGDIVIPEIVEIYGKVYKVTAIAEAGFKNCENLSSIKMHSGINEFGWQCFAFCKRIKDIIIPKSLKLNINHGNYGFFVGCENLTDIIIEDGNTVFTVSDGALLTDDGKGMVAYAPGLQVKNYVMPETIEWMSQCVFSDNNNIETVRMSSKLSKIERYTFYNCKSLKTVYLPDNLQSIEVWAFVNSSIEEIDLPSKLKVIEQYSFTGCDLLKQITIPQSVVTIGENAFGGCISLESITVRNAAPLSISETVFQGGKLVDGYWVDNVIYDNTLLYVPFGRSKYYQQAVGWGKFTHIEEINMPDVDVNDNPFENIEENQMILGHYRGEEIGENGFGGEARGKYKACIGIFKEALMPFNGSKIKAVRFALTNTNIKNVKFWIGSSRNKQDISLQDVNEIAMGWNIVKLEEYYTIQNDSIFIGIEYDSEIENNYPISYIGTGIANLETGCGFLYGPYGENGENEWVDVLSYIPYSGRLNIQCIIEGDNIPMYDIHMVSKEFHEYGDPIKYFKQGKNSSFMTYVAMKDWGKQSVGKDYELIGYVDGNPLSEFNGNESQPMVSNPVDYYRVDGNIKADYQIGSHKFKVAVKSIKGKLPDFPLDDTASKEIKIYSKDMGRQKQLVQLYTATWCPDALSINREVDLLKKDNPNVVQVSFHSGDEMSCVAGNEYYKLTPFAVDVSYNRYMGAGHHGFVNTHIDDLFNMPAFADVHISSSYDEKKRQLDIIVKGSRNEEFLPVHGFTNLTVLLTEDDVVAPQYDSGNDVWISEYKHQAVLRTNVSAVWGDPIEWNGDNYEMNYSIRLHEDWNKDNMHIVAFLAKPFDGSNFTDIEVMNCNDFAVKDAEIIESTGIREISVTNPADIYTLQGHKVRMKATTLEGLPKGGYIVNGKKVVVK